MTQVLQHSESHVQSIAKSPTMIIKHPEGGPIKTPTESGQGQPLPKDNQRPSIDGPDRRPTVNKRKAPPPITPSIIKAAGLPPSLATNAKPQLPLSATSPTRSDQAPREAQGNLNSQNKMTSVQEIYEASPRQHGRQSDGNVDGLGGLGATSPLVGLPTSSSNAPSNITEEAFHPMRSLTLQNLALSESTENVVRHADDVSSKQAHDHREVASQPSTAVATSPSGPLAYMTDSTKIRWDKGMAEIAKQLKEQDG